LSEIGPNVKKLIAAKMAADAIPAGGGLQSGIEYLLAPGLGQRAKAAADWVRQAIQVVKSAPDNPFGDDDEAIAGELLRLAETRRAE
jgi:hypothetical protein